MCLLNGKTGVQNLLGAQTGNMRAIHHGWHPIVRQRTLSVRTHAQVEIPRGAKLIIDEITLGTFREERAFVETGLQRFKNNRGETFRLPPLQLEFDLNFISDLHPFGPNRVSHPGGGCDKGLQRGLGISFDCPSAWSRLETKNLKIRPL